MAEANTIETVEVWKRVPGTPFEVSNLGGLRDLQGGAVPRSNITAKNRYVRVSFGRRKLSLHRMILEAFVGPASGRYGLHRNDDRRDNRLENLYWGTPADNNADRSRNWRAANRTWKAPGAGGGTRAYARGSGHKSAKLTEAQVLEIRARYKHGNGPALAREFHIGSAQLSRIILRQCWRHV